MFSMKPSGFVFIFKGMYIQELKIDAFYVQKYYFIFSSPPKKKESSCKAREPLVYVDGLKAGLKPGGQQARAEESIFKTCVFQGFGKISWFCLDLITIIFPFLLKTSSSQWSPRRQLLEVPSTVMGELLFLQEREDPPQRPAQLLGTACSGLKKSNQHCISKLQTSNSRSPSMARAQVQPLAVTTERRSHQADSRYSQLSC